MSIIIDTEPALTGLRKCVAIMFGIDEARIEVRGSGAVNGAAPVLIVEVRVDGEPVTGEVREFVEGIFGGAKKLAAMKAEDVSDDMLRDEVRELIARSK